MLSLYFSQVTHEEILQNRKEILETSLEDLKGHQELYTKIFLDKYLCVVGNNNKIKSNEELFNKIKELK